MQRVWISILLLLLLVDTIGKDKPVPMKDKSIPYCQWNGQAWLPCMYSSKEYKA